MHDDREARGFSNALADESSANFGNRDDGEANEGVHDDATATGIGKIKELFACVRDLLFTGFQKCNPVENLQEVGDILDDYHDEAQDGEKRGILDLFTQLTEELMNEGFLGEILNKALETDAPEKVAKIPQDHKKKEK